MKTSSNRTYMQSISISTAEQLSHVTSEFYAQPDAEFLIFDRCLGRGGNSARCHASLYLKPLCSSVGCETYVLLAIT